MGRACRRGLGARGSYDLGSCDRLHDHQEAAGIVSEDTASALFGVEGLRVTDVQAGPGGALEVRAVTDYPAAAACPDCGMVSGRVHETVPARPRDVRRAADPVDLRWVKFRRKCGNPECPRKTFTEQVPGLPPRCRITARLREQAGAEVTKRGITPAEAARHAGISWPVVHDAFAAAAGPPLDQPAEPVAHLGIDEHRRGRVRFAVDPQTREYTLLADRWHTCFFDLSGGQGLLGRDHQRHLREPEPARQARGPPGLRVPQPGEPAPPGPHRLHPRVPAPVTHRNSQEDTFSNRTETRSRLTSKVR